MSLCDVVRLIVCPWHFWMFHAILSAQKNFHPKFFFNELWVKQGETQCYQAFLFIPTLLSRTSGEHLTQFYALVALRQRPGKGPTAASEQL